MYPGDPAPTHPPTFPEGVFRVQKQLGPAAYNLYALRKNVYDEIKQKWNMYVDCLAFLKQTAISLHKYRKKCKNNVAQIEQRKMVFSKKKRNNAKKKISEVLNAKDKKHVVVILPFSKSWLSPKRDVPFAKFVVKVKRLQDRENRGGQRWGEAHCYRGQAFFTNREGGGHGCTSAQNCFFR